MRDRAVRRPQAARLDRKRAGAHARTSAAPPPTPSRPGRAEAPPRSPRAAREPLRWPPGAPSAPAAPAARAPTSSRRAAASARRAAPAAAAAPSPRASRSGPRAGSRRTAPAWPGPSRAACSTMRSISSSARPPARAARRPGPPAASVRSRSRCSRSAANRRGSCPASTSRSTASNTAARSPAASASTTSSISATSVTPSSATARSYVTPSGPAPGQQLVEHRQRVAGRAAARADDQRVHRRGDDGALLGADALQQAAQRARRDQPERVVVGARPDRRQHLLRLGGREDEDEVLRRLLDDLEQGVEALRGDHVRLVDDEHPVARLGGREERPIAQLTGVVDAAVRGGVELDDVDVARPARAPARRTTSTPRTARASAPARS